MSNTVVVKFLESKGMKTFMKIAVLVLLWVAFSFGVVLVLTSIHKSELKTLQANNQKALELVARSFVEIA